MQAEKVCFYGVCEQQWEMTADGKRGEQKFEKTQPEHPKSVIAKGPLTKEHKCLQHHVTTLS